MCAECVELDKSISHYRKILENAFDPLTTDRIKETIAEMERRKAELHSVA
jgi:TATA-binding protein-associated factor Taf7